MMESRREQLSQLRHFIEEADNEVTLILQTLQWDRDTLMQEMKADPMVTCKYDSNHRIPLKTQKEHEEKCCLKSQGYDLDDAFLPDPLDPHAKTVTKLTPDDIKQIIDAASKKDPLFKRGSGSVDTEPLTWARRAVAYTADERRALYDAVVSANPAAHDLSDLALAGCDGGSSAGAAKSREQVLAELRNMRRRRARYRGAAPASYSHTLRDLIATQMELYTGINTETEMEQNNDKASSVQSDAQKQEDEHNEEYTKERERKVFDYRDNNREKEREHYTQGTKQKYKHTDDNYSRKRERTSSTYSEREKESSTYSERERDRINYCTQDYRRHDKYDAYREERDSVSRDRKRHHNDEGQGHRERIEDRTERQRYRERTEDKTERQRYRERTEDKTERQRYRERTKDRTEIQRHRERTEDKYRRSEKTEYTRYYGNHNEKSRRHLSEEKSSSKEYR